ncbi:conserved hypothetical protein [Leishmania major strain Friedlin]|uniref:Uncharacterized protein n=1 Tax=Leishmania major TaxID=5664 RepID=Q4QA31_LEIMA|nr:conserved hypothetical protein [Leishmania major strain Friedlin]CAG9575074.1 hypothetical_protein_-_conserved [Leishmania major strain Friedlin]CAJ04836.1 conserved hypothetical protein [Leishmania major strain Friedlin]|eukprot:XP_001683817.1 conserved hypothetical protein [Leishmania major strain Friedlin]
MSEAVVRAERELYAYVVALQNVLHAATEDAMPQSLWDGAREKDGELSDPVADGNPHSEMPDTLIQQVERETALERRRIHELVRRQLAPQRAALRAAIVQLGGGQDASGNIIDVPVALLDQEIAAAATESAELGRRMVELYDEAALLATRIEAEVMGKSVPPL